MLNSPTAPTFSRESFQRKMSRQEARSESHSPPPVEPLNFPHSDGSIKSPSPARSHEDRFEPGPSPSVELPSRDTSWDSVTTNDTVAPPRREDTPGVPSSSTLAVQGDAPDETSLSIPEHSATIVTTEIVPVEAQLQVSGPVTTEPTQARARPITPIPMVLPPPSISHRWQSPSPSASHEEAGILGDRGVIEETPEMSKEAMDMPREIERATQSSSPVPVEPVVIRGRLVTPPSQEHTPAPVPTSPEARRGSSHSTTGSSSSDEESSEETEETEETEDEDDSDEDSDTKMASGSDDSDSLTPAPSPPAVTRLPVASSTTAALPIQGTVRSPIEPSSSKPDDLVTGDPIPNFIENQASLTNAATSPASVALELNQRSTSVAISIDEAPNDLPPSSSTPIDTPQAPAELEELTVPAIPVRRMTLKDYARRKKKDVGVSPTAQIPPAGLPVLNAGWSSPLAGRIVPLPDHSSSEPPLSSSEPASGSQALATDGQHAYAKAGTPPVPRVEIDDVVIPEAAASPLTPITVSRTSPLPDLFRFPVSSSFSVIL
jgi:hypothetical protein